MAQNMDIVGVNDFYSRSPKILSIRMLFQKFLKMRLMKKKVKSPDL